ncbi:hypothetical protein BH20ACI3_BH20ACI3_13090 [soil metagenome]
MEPVIGHYQRRPATRGDGCQLRRAMDEVSTTTRVAGGSSYGAISKRMDPPAARDVVLMTR